MVKQNDLEEANKSLKVDNEILEDDINLLRIRNKELELKHTVESINENRKKLLNTISVMLEDFEKTNGVFISDISFVKASKESGNLTVYKTLYIDINI